MRAPPHPCHAHLTGRDPARVVQERFHVGTAQCHVPTEVIVFGAGSAQLHARRHVNWQPCLSSFAQRTRCQDRALRIKESSCRPRHCELCMPRGHIVMSSKCLHPASASLVARWFHPAFCGVSRHGASLARPSWPPFLRSRRSLMRRERVRSFVRHAARRSHWQASVYSRRRAMAVACAKQALFGWTSHAALSFSSVRIRLESPKVRSTLADMLPTSSPIWPASPPTASESGQTPPHSS